MVIRTMVLGLVVCLVFPLAAALPAAGQGSGDASSAAVPVEQWTGKVFTVLPLEGGKKAEGYPFRLVAAGSEQTVAGGTNIRAGWLEGKKLEVVEAKLINTVQEVPAVQDYEVTFREQAGGATIIARAMGGQVESLVPADDLVNARKHFAGKTVYSKRQAIAAFQDTPGTVTVRIDEPLQITDVIAGISANEPIWLVVATQDNRKGYIAIAYTLTNVQPGYWRDGKPWLSVVFEQNPRELFTWDDETWANINAGVVKAGMLRDQVRLAWGEPLSVRSADGEEVWYYADKLVKFHSAAGLYLIQER